MKKTLTILSAVALLQAGGAMAKGNHLAIPQSALPAGVSAELVNKKLAQMNFLNVQSGVANKTTATERVTGVADYDYTQTPALQDTMHALFSHGRGSAFDWLGLQYDFSNQYSFPSPTNFGTSYVNFDTLMDHTTGSGSVNWLRSYNAANQVVRDENQNEIDLFDYDASNKLIKLTGIQNSGTSWDSSFRDFYKYNSSGYMTMDSLEIYDVPSATWTSYINFVYTNDGSGRPTQVDLKFQVGGGITLTVARIQTSYFGTTGYPTRLLIQQLNSSLSLVNSSKDTLGYTSNQITYHDSFEWDTLANVWNLAAREVRRLNGAGLPDSVWFKDWTNKVPTDSGYHKLAYNSNNNPTYRRDYIPTSANLQAEARWYYGPVESAGVGTPKATKLDFYPNPANEKIQLRGITQGNYQIFNAAGQLMQSGSVQNGGSVPVQLLSPGMYTLSVQGTNRQLATATFVKQ
jgi:hypothetical protein